MDPYEFKKVRYQYSFETDNKIQYSAQFKDGSKFFLDLPFYIPVYEFAVLPIGLPKNQTPPLDLRIEMTIGTIIKDFLVEYENSVLYICDMKDKRAATRFRKFNSWYNRQNDLAFKKVDTRFFVFDIEIFASLIVHESNLFFDELIEIFLAQKEKIEGKNPDSE